MQLGFRPLVRYNRIASRHRLTATMQHHRLNLKILIRRAQSSRARRKVFIRSQGYDIQFYLDFKVGKISVDLRFTKHAPRLQENHCHLL
jgi:hypothetical protein